MQLVLDMRAVEHLPEPRPLPPRVAGEMENDRNTLRQNGVNVRRDGMLQAAPLLQRLVFQHGLDIGLEVVAPAASTSPGMLIGDPEALPSKRSLASTLRP